MWSNLIGHDDCLSLSVNDYLESTSNQMFSHGRQTHGDKIFDEILDTALSKDFSSSLLGQSKQLEGLFSLECVCVKQKGGSKWLSTTWPKQHQ